MIDSEPPFVVKQYDALPEVAFPGTHIRPFLNLDETKDLICFHIRIDPNALVDQAYHKIAIEVIWVMGGSGTALLGDKEVPLQLGSILLIRPPTPHGFKAGPQGLEIFSITTPRVDSKTDFYWRGAKHGELKTVSGQWAEGPVK